MEIKVGDICKHFKGKDLIEKNIYEILAIDIIYTGDNNIDLKNMVVYRPLFQKDKYFAREYSDLIEELSSEDKIIYNQNQRVEVLNEDELKLIETKEFIKLKEEYIKNKY